MRRHRSESFLSQRFCYKTEAGFYMVLYIQLMTQLTNQSSSFFILASCQVDRFSFHFIPKLSQSGALWLTIFWLQVPISGSHLSPSSLFTGAGQCSAMHHNLKLMKRKKSETSLSCSYWSLSLSDSSSSTEDTTLLIFSVTFLQQQQKQPGCSKCPSINAIWMQSRPRSQNTNVSDG